MTAKKNKSSEGSTEGKSRRSKKSAEPSAEAENPFASLPIDPDDIPAPGRFVSPKQIKVMRHYRSVGLSYEEIAKHLGLSAATVYRETKDVVIVEAPAANSPGPTSVGQLPTASITSPMSPTTTKITLTPELKPDVLPVKNNGGDVVATNPPPSDPAQNGNGNTNYGAQQGIDVTMRSLTFDWPSQMIVDMTAMSRYNKFPNVQSYHNDLVERSRAVDELTRWVGPWKGDADEFIGRVKPAFIISHSVLEKAEEAKAAAEEQRRKELLQRSGSRPPDFLNMGKN